MERMAVNRFERLGEVGKSGRETPPLPAPPKKKATRKRQLLQVAGVQLEHSPKTAKKVDAIS